MSKYSNELHVTYQQGISAFLESYPKKDSTLVMQIDSFSRTCALTLWYQFIDNIELCTEAINEIYTKETQRKIFTQKQVEEAFAFLSKGNCNIKIPDFFENIVSYDTENKTNYSRRFASGMLMVFMAFLLIDEQISFEEVRLATKFHQVLTDFCDLKMVLPYKTDFDPFSYVTESDEKPQPKRQLEKQIKANSSNKTSDKNPIEELKELIGLQSVKKEIDNIVNFATVQKLRKDKNLPTTAVSYHLVFTGNPGTGKTTVARIIAKIYKDLNILSNGHLVEVSSSDLVAGYVGQTAIKTQEVIKSAIGGVLFIDEAYTLVDDSGQGFGQEAIDTILKEMEDHRDNLVIIVAGYDELMEKFISSNPGLKSRFNRYIHFEDYNAQELYQIFISLCEKNKYTISDTAKQQLTEYFENLSASKNENFGNGRDVRNLFEKVITKQANRLSKSAITDEKALVEIIGDDVEWDGNSKENLLESGLEDLNSLVGVSKTKKEVENLINLVKLQKARKEQGLSTPDMSLHLVFSGNPGTGKTTVARIIAKIYKGLGLLSEGQLIETDRSDLVAGYVGQTAIKTKNVINKAIGGVLFIDEAYTLSENEDNGFGQEAIDTLLKAMEDNRDNLVVIVAGYDNLMDNFIASNPGLQSRFNKYIHFEDYSPSELREIFKGLCKKNQYTLSDDGEKVLSTYFENIDSSDIGNARGVRNIFEKAVTSQANRFATSGDTSTLASLTDVDINFAINN